MARPDLDNYVPVNQRVMQFRDKHPEGALVTLREPDLLLNGGDTVFVRFKALAFRNQAEIELYGKTGIATATGHSELELGNDKVTEKCESIAIGRALATLGFSADKSMASKEEMEEFVAHEEKQQSSFKAKPVMKREAAQRDEDEEAPAPRSRLGQKKAAPVEADDEDDAPAPRSRLGSKKATPVVEEDSDDEEGEEIVVPQKRASSFRNVR